MVMNESLRQLLLLEMIARVAKNGLRAKMRSLASADDFEFNSAVVDFFNLIFWPSVLLFSFCFILVVCVVLLRLI